jgi:hypothetical protein
VANLAWDLLSCNWLVYVLYCRFCCLKLRNYFFSRVLIHFNWGFYFCIFLLKAKHAWFSGCNVSFLPRALTYIRITAVLLTYCRFSLIKVTKRSLMKNRRACNFASILRYKQKYFFRSWSISGVFVKQTRYHNLQRLWVYWWYFLLLFVHNNLL